MNRTPVFVDLDLTVDDPDESPRNAWRFICKYALNLTPQCRRVALAIDAADGDQVAAREFLSMTQRDLGNELNVLQRHRLLLVCSTGAVKRHYDRRGLDVLLAKTKARFGQAAQ